MAENLRTVDGHRIRLTSLDRIVYPQANVTKGEVIDYIEAVAPQLTLYSRDRAATRKRWMKGVGTESDPGDSFFHKNLDDDAPSWIRSYVIRHEGHSNRYPLLDDAAALVWFAQRGTLEFHVPQWRFRKGGKHEHPDRLVLDLDPGQGADLASCAKIAHLARQALDAEGLQCVPVTSGSTGIHVYAPLSKGLRVDEVNDLAHRLATRLEEDHPDLVTANLRKKRRKGRVLVDWSQNNGAKTTVVPFSLRGRPHPTVAVPRQWEEVNESLEQLDMGDALERAKAGDDPLAAALEVP